MAIHPNCRSFKPQAHINVGKDFTDSRFLLRLFQQRLKGVAAVAENMLTAATAKFLDERQ